MRLLLRGALGLLLLLSALAAIGIVFRTHALGFVLEQGLAYAGFERPALRIERVGWESTEIIDLRLGPDLSVARIRLDYRLPELWDGRLRRVVLTTPVVDLTAAGGLDRLVALTAGGGSGGTGVTLPEIEVDKGEVRLGSDFGPVRLHVDGALSVDRPQGMHGRFAVIAEAEAGRLDGSIVLISATEGRYSAELHVRRGELALAELALTGVQLDGRFDWAPGSEPKLDVEGQVAAFQYRGEAAGRADIEVTLEDETAALALRGEAFGAPFALAVDGDLDLGGRRLAVRLLTATSTVTPAATLPARLGLPSLRRGRLRAQLVAGGLDLQSGDLPGSLPEAVAWLQRSAFEASATISADDLSVTGWCERAELVLGLDARAVAGRIEFALAAPTLAEFEGLAPEWRDRLPLPIAGPAMLEMAPGAALSLAAGARPSLRAHGESAVSFTSERFGVTGIASVNAELWPRWLAREIAVSRLNAQARNLDIAGQAVAEARFEGSAALRAGTWAGQGIAWVALRDPHLGDLRARRLEAELPLDLDAGKRALVLSRPGRLSLFGGTFADAITLRERVDLGLSAGDGSLLRAAGDDWSFSLAAALAEPITLTVQPGDTPLALGTGAMRIAARFSPPLWTRIDARIALDSLGLPRHDLVAQNLVLDLALTDASPSGEARLSVARIETFDPRLPRLPLAFDGRVVADRGKGNGEATVSGGDGLARITLGGQFDLAAGQAMATAVLSPLLLDEALRRLRDVWPMLAPVTSMAGRVAAETQLAWNGSKLTSRGAVTLDELSLATRTAAVRGLSGRIALDTLWPPETREAQRLKLRGVSGPIEVRDTELMLALEPVPGRVIGRIRLERAEAVTELGHLIAAEGILDPVGGEHALTLGTEDLDLARLLTLVKVEGLAGTGRLAGRLRAEYSNGTLTIPPATLTATGPGVIRFTSAAAKRALASSGEQVALMLQALENFHYDSLSLGLEKRADGSGNAKLAIRGNNPEVLDGYPFALNIDLSADFDSLLETVMEAYDLSGRALRATVK